jgi:antitoxin component YwqK of YwqJK toxin-antitoxin module
MKNFLAICFYFSFFTLFSQTVENDIEYFNSGQMKWKGQKSCITIKDDKECKPIGLWTYYYKDGQKKSEILFPGGKGNLPTRYINTWQQDGFQILKNGIGFYYDKENRGGGEYDSLSYQVKDSLANGMYSHYRKQTGHNYYLIETGQFSDGKKYGTFKFRDTVKLYEEETNYDNGEVSNYKYFHPNFKLKEEGKTVNGKKEGLSKFYNDKGILIKEVNYKKDTEFGEYKEYYDDGALKSTGHYKHTKGFITNSTFDSQGNVHERKTASDNIPQKSGEWKYFDEKGTLIKTEVLK